MKARIHLEPAFAVGTIDPRIWGSFLEHLGRAIYTGVWEPGHPGADADGFRTDVLALVKELRVPLVRYPGGNFVSSYRWEDSVGPQHLRPRRLDLAWRTVEPNTFGLNEFMRWTKKAGTQAMMSLNLGTRGIDAARNLVEYANHPGGTYWSDLRKSHGVQEPYDIRMWCLGNELDGPWQVGQKTAEDYGRLAAEVGKALHLFDPKLELVAVGSSFPGMPTFPQWEATVLEHCYDHVDYLSLHQYQNNTADDTETYLACSRGMDSFIESVIATCDYVKAKKRSSRTMYLSFDEWNVWFHSLSQDKLQEPWTEAPALLEDTYTFEDALVVGCLINSLIRHADRVKIACLAQLVNVIAPIRTEVGGVAWRQSIYWPFYYASRYGRGTSIDVRAFSPCYDNRTWGDVPYLDVSAVLGDDGGLSVFCVNRHLSESLDIDLSLRAFENLRGAVRLEHVELARHDLKATNSALAPDEVVPATTSRTSEGDRVELRAAASSWNLFRFERT